LILTLTLQVLTPHSGDRQASEGLEVMAGAPILLVHCATQKPLCIEQQHKVPSDFGLEYELSTHQAVSTGIQSGLEHMKQVGCQAISAARRC
jgi:hypothetical protein